MKNATDEYVQCPVVATWCLTQDLGARHPSSLAKVESRDGLLDISVESD
jgi:hypothetical protein